MTEPLGAPREARSRGGDAVARGLHAAWTWRRLRGVDCARCRLNRQIYAHKCSVRVSSHTARTGRWDRFVRRKSHETHNNLLQHGCRATGSAARWSLLRARRADPVRRSAAMATEEGCRCARTRPSGRRRLRCLPSSLVSHVPEARGAAHRPYCKELLIIPNRSTSAQRGYRVRHT